MTKIAQLRPLERKSNLLEPLQYRILLRSCSDILGACITDVVRTQAVHRNTIKSSGFQKKWQHRGLPKTDSLYFSSFISRLRQSALNRRVAAGHAHVRTVTETQTESFDLARCLLVPRFPHFDSTFGVFTQAKQHRTIAAAFQPPSCFVSVKTEPFHEPPATAMISHIHPEPRPKRSPKCYPNLVGICHSRKKRSPSICCSLFQEFQV